YAKLVELRLGQLRDEGHPDRIVLLKPPAFETKLRQAWEELVARRGDVSQAKEHADTAQVQYDSAGVLLKNLLDNEVSTVLKAVRETCRGGGTGTGDDAGGAS